MAKTDVLYKYYDIWAKSCDNSVVWLNGPDCNYTNEVRQTKIVEYKKDKLVYERLRDTDWTWEEYCKK